MRSIFIWDLFFLAGGGSEILGPSFTVSIAEDAGVLTATVSEISATGTASYSYDWRKDGISLGAADQVTYDTSDDPGAYSVRVTGTDDAGSVVRNSNTITISAPVVGTVYEAGVYEEGVYA